MICAGCHVFWKKIPKKKDFLFNINVQMSFKLLIVSVTRSLFLSFSFVVCQKHIDRKTPRITEKKRY